MKTSAEIRQLFLDFFKAKGHQVVPSASLVPANDQTLLFTNSGMVPFKEIFLGQQSPSSPCAVSAQRCVRAGGKHNDLENVGYTARHHTFFEMLGNFSFGDYFKQKAIVYAWEFLTQVAGLPADRLWVTVYQDDDEAASIWLDELGIHPDRLSRIGDKPGAKDFESDNFWTMGDTGPCGPCTEIFYDHGPEIAGGPPGTSEEEGDRYIEIWNLVFMQYNRDSLGGMSPLPRPSVDTGMGLERLAAVLQSHHDNYQTDILASLIQAAADCLGCTNQHQQSLKVISDHIRSSAFLIVDGVQAANEGRGYVLRRIIRRAIRHGYQLGRQSPFFHQLVDPLCQQMGLAYPELERARKRVVQVLKQEEVRFFETLERGMKIFHQTIGDLPNGKIPGEIIFRLYDTYGFPVDLTADIAREQGLEVDMAGFEHCMDKQRQRARAKDQFKVDYGNHLPVVAATDFTGYEQVSGRSTIIALSHQQQPVDVLNSGQSGHVVLKATPFYPRSGGQVGDQGSLFCGANFFEVSDTQKQGQAIIHSGQLKTGMLGIGDEVELAIDHGRRQKIALNHSATHLLHAALRQVLGEHITQMGSLVDAQRLRFDFSHPAPVSHNELSEIEALVNQEIRANHQAKTRVMELESAIQSGAIALFGEKYDQQVRVLSLGEFSIELCGGTHVQRTGDIGLFQIVVESGIAAGVRRIEAITGETALNWVNQSRHDLDKISTLLKSPQQEIVDKVNCMTQRLRAVDKELGQLKAILANAKGDDLADQAIEVGGIKVLAQVLDNTEVKVLRETVDRLKNKLGQSAIVLASVEHDQIRLIAGVSKALSQRLPAGELVNMVAQQVGGRGGGRADMAQAGGHDIQALPNALQSVASWVEQRLVR